MKKVIHGKLYNTETAQEIGRYVSPRAQSDFYYYDETLYKTKKGTYFLAGEGNALSQWSISNGNTSKWGSGISPLKEENALYWCETHGVNPDLITEHFKIEEA